MPSRSKNAGKRVAVGVGTSSSGLLLTSDGERKKWKKVGPFLAGESVNCIRYDQKNGRLYAATHTNGVFVSKDFGRTWKQTNDGLHVKKSWTIESDSRNPKILYAGTQYGHLFKSVNAGESWEEVTGLFEAPKREAWGVDWGFGTVGLCIHTIRMDPSSKDRFYIVSSGGGPYRTDDGGKKWSLLNKGVMENCTSQNASADVWGLGKDASSEKNREMHLSQVHKCTHKLVVSKKTPGLLFQQNHCGVYRSLDSGETWEDISPDERRHGFPMALIENGSSSLFTIPAYQGEGCKKHNSCIQGELAVYRTQDAGRTWEGLANGLPKKNHTCVLRDAMSVDSLASPGVYFGTTTGEVYGSTDLGGNWSTLLQNSGRVQGISAFEF